MVDAASAFETAIPKDHLLTAKDTRRFQRLFEAQATRSYLYLSLGIGVIAVLLPLLLMLAGGYEGHDSMSSYYTIDVWPSRDVLVGSLCAVGVFLFLFHGLSRLENWLLNFAGIAVIAVALIPMSVSEVLHRGFAIVFFLLIGIVAIFLSKGRIKDIGDERKKLWFASAYTTAGAAMIVMPLIVAALQFAPGGLRHWMFWTECAGIWAFSAYWLLKTFEYRLLLRIRWTARSK